MARNTNSNKGKSIGYREPTKPLHPLVYALRKRRHDMGIGAEVIAHRMGYDVQTLQSWEHGASKPALYSLEIWAATLGMELALKEKQ